MPRDGRLPLSFAQQRLWFMDQLEQGSAAYNIPEAIRLSGALNLPALERSLDEIVRRHEVLRTVFETVEGEPVQVIRPHAPFPLPLTDLSGLAEPERGERLRRAVDEERRRCFDLSSGPLVRAQCLRRRRPARVAARA